jgi:hypothetical protein
MRDYPADAVVVQVADAEAVDRIPGVVDERADAVGTVVVAVEGDMAWVVYSVEDAIIVVVDVHLDERIEAVEHREVIVDPAATQVVDPGLPAEMRNDPEAAVLVDDDERPGQVEASVVDLGLDRDRDLVGVVVQTAIQEVEDDQEVEK